jgi:hypothetical protein
MVMVAGEGLDPMTLRSDDFEPSASASPPQRSSALLHFNITKLKGVIAHALM